MTGKGIRKERETSIVFNEEDSDMEIRTASEVVYRKLKKNGFYPFDETDRSATFRVPKSSFRIPRMPSEARIRAGKALGALKKATSSVVGEE